MLAKTINEILDKIDQEEEDKEFAEQLKRHLRSGVINHDEYLSYFGLYPELNKYKE